MEAAGRVEACEPPGRLLVTIRETDESYRKGSGVPPFDESLEVTLTADGDQAVLVIEVRGAPWTRSPSTGSGGRSTPSSSPPTSPVVRGTAATLDGPSSSRRIWTWQPASARYKLLASWPARLVP
jgi:hypothetical protein